VGPTPSAESTPGTSTPGSGTPPSTAARPDHAAGPARPGHHHHRPVGGRRGGPAHRRLERARRTARDNLTEVRRLVWDLRPEALSAAPLGEALGRLADRVAEETGLAATATVTGTPRPLSADAEVTLLRVTQEALANVTRHARAGRVAVTLSYMEDEAALDVRDDGAGFAPQGFGCGPRRRPRPARHARAGRGARWPPGRGERPRGGHHRRRDGAGPMTHPEGAGSPPGTHRSGSCWSTTTRWSGTGCGGCWPARPGSRWWARPPPGPRRCTSASGNGPTWS
jgi:Histidine kinase